MRLFELQEQRANLIAEMRTLVEHAETEKRDLADNERGRFDAIKSELAGLDSRISRAALLAEAERHAHAEPLDGHRNGTPDLSRYSVARALRCAMNGKVDGIEGEVHAELSRGRETRGNVMVPTAILLSERERRAQLVTPDTAGGYTVATTLGAVADRFRPVLKTESMGATVLRDLTGFLDLPNLASSGSTAWIGENQAATRSSAAFEKVAMSPRTISGEYEMSRRLMIQSSESIEQLLRRDLGFILAQGLDRAAIKGTGAPTEPTGILDSGIVKVATAAALTDTASDLMSALELDDVTGTRAFFSNPFVAGIARKLKDGNGLKIPMSSIFHDQRFEISTQVPDDIGSGSNKSALIYGQWSELIVGYWSAVDILLNPYHSDVASKGGALLHAFLDCDTAVRHTEAFVYSEI